MQDRAGLEAALAAGHKRWRRLLVQQYVEGREFNLAVVGDRVLPHAEMGWALRITPRMPHGRGWVVRGFERPLPQWSDFLGKAA